VTELLTQCARTMVKLKPMFPEFHTRFMKREFKAKFANLATVSAGCMDLIYKELALDSSAARNADSMKRLRLIFLGETGLLTDLRSINPGRPTGNFDTFFDALGRVIEEVTAADERRHNVAHMSEWLSLKDLMNRAVELCPENTPIPSPSLVRLQFTPRNPYIHTALNFTSRFEVQYKIQRRQLRLFHEDDHYCAALLKYLKHLAVTLKDECVMFCCDDKAKVHLGEPGAVLSTGVRGKKTLAPTGTMLAALDHDVHHKGSLTPSVYLHISIPDEPTKSFCRGQVTTVINDSIFQSSNPFRHAATLVKEINKLETLPSVLLKFSDGGTDQRNTLESVKCSLICVFKELNLDMLIAARCAPGHSWTNPAERVMSLLNIGLQNCALERVAGDDTLEKALKAASSMDAIRKLGVGNELFVDAWQASIEPCISAVQNRFGRLKLKEKPLQVSSPVQSVDMDNLQEHLKNVFPDLDTTKLTKLYTSRCPSYMQWLDTHCRQRQYSFQIRKCSEPECCGVIRTAQDKLKWLPDPTIDRSGDGTHFLPFESVYGLDTNENDRPSLKEVQSLKRSAQPKIVKTVRNDLQDMWDGNAALIGDSSIFTAQNAHALIDCIDCRKPRVIYSKTKLTDRQKMQLALLMSQYDYTCGSPATPPTHTLHGKVLTRLTLTCESTIEIPYYSAEIGRKDVCCYCASEGATVDDNLKKQFKTVLPLCASCVQKKLVAPCLRPYGPSTSK